MTERTFESRIRSRREFLRLGKDTIALGVISGVTALISDRPNLDRGKENSGSMWPSHVAENFQRESNYKRTAMETVGLLGTEIAVDEVGSRVGLKLGATQDDTFYKMSPLEELRLTIGVLPAAEEGIFRFAPSVALSLLKQTGQQWKFGLPISAIFALAHNLDWTYYDRVYLRKDSIPLPQFLSGIYLWGIMRKRGIGHAIMSHSIMNGLILGLVKAESFRTHFKRSKSE